MSAQEPQAAGRKVAGGRHRTTLAHTTIAFLCIVCAWMAIDQIAKRVLDSVYCAGQIVTEPVLGIFRVHLVHNSGMAWGMFGGSSLFLAIFSLVVCLVLVIYLFGFSEYRTPLEIIGVSLVVAGGLGNAIDRFFFGTVVDFIEPTFINFPVFNIADIGVTCGVVIFIISLFFAFPRKEDEKPAHERRSQDGKPHDSSN